MKHHALLVLGLLLITLLSLLFLTPVSDSDLRAGRKAQAKNDVTQLAIAVASFQAEYGHPPITGRHLVSHPLIAALTGSDATLNPRHIVFMETTPFKKGKGGLRDGLWLDPWGNPFHIAIARPGDHHVIAGTNNLQIKKTVAVWNDPRHHTPSPWWSLSKKTPPRYVTSWD